MDTEDDIPRMFLGRVKGCRRVRLTTSPQLLAEFYFCGIHPVTLNYHTFQICLQSQLKCFSLLYYISYTRTCFGPWNTTSVIFLKCHNWCCIPREDGPWGPKHVVVKDCNKVIRVSIATAGIFEKCGSRMIWKMSHNPMILLGLLQG
jgi:hypothetical protein